jgi:hypothetical protein
MKAKELSVACAKDAKLAMRQMAKVNIFLIINVVVIQWFADAKLRFYIGKKHIKTLFNPALLLYRKRE